MSTFLPTFQHDKVYYDLLTSVKDRNCSQDILSFLCFTNAAFPLGKGSSMLGEILGYKERKIIATLHDLNRVMVTPSFTETYEEPEDIKRLLLTLLPDFQDYLIDKNRSKDFYISPQRAYEQLARTFLLHLPSSVSTLQETSRPTMFLVSRLFLSLFAKMTQASEDLWNDLFELDFHAYLILLRQSFHRQWDLFNEASRLLTWIKRHDYYAMDGLGFKKSLYSYYLEGWDRKVGGSLRQLAASRQASNNLAILQYPHHLNTGPEFFGHMSKILGDPDSSKQVTEYECIMTSDGIWLLGGHASKDSSFLPILLEYLDDPSRSGDFWNIQDRLVSVSETIIKFLFTHAIPSDLKANKVGKSSYSAKELRMLPTASGTFLYALRCLPGYLVGASYDSKLASYLKSHSLDISPRVREKVDFDLAVKFYKSKKYSESNARRRLIPIPSSEEVKFTAEDAVKTMDTTTTEDYHSSLASSSTGLSTWDYGFYWTRRAFSQETVDTIRSKQENL